MIVKDAAEFSGSLNYCRVCFSGYMKDYRETKGSDWVREKDRRAHLAAYGLTVESFDALLRDQGGACAICRATEPGGRGGWCIDHDHSCCPGRRKSCGACIRGLLCNNCNNGLGRFNDSVERLRAAAKYLNRFNRYRDAA